MITKYLGFVALLIGISCSTPTDKSGKISLENDADMIGYGKVLFAKHCQQCHGESGTSMMANIPDLTKTTLNDEESIGNMIFHGKGNMPGFESTLGEPEIRAISLYILSIKK